jgi:ABC-2 type transport system permease protein
VLHSVFERSVHDQRRALVGWAIGVALYTAMVVAVYPTIRDRPDVQRVIDDYPEALRKLFSIRDIGSPAGFLNGYLLSVMIPLLLIIYAVLVGGDATAGEEERRTIDLLLANPISRTRVLLEKLGGLAAGTSLLGLSLYMTVVVLAPAVGLHVPYMRLAEATVAMVLVAVEFGAIAVLFGAATGRRGVARGTAAAIAASSYLLSSLSTMVGGLRPWRLASPYYHAIGTDPMRHGLDPVHWAVLIASTAFLALAAGWWFDRRDLAT